MIRNNKVVEGKKRKLYERRRFLLSKRLYIWISKSLSMANVEVPGARCAPILR